MLHLPQQLAEKTGHNRYSLQARGRSNLYAEDNGALRFRVPTTLEDEDSALRHVFRAADKKQRREKTGRESHSIDVRVL